MKVPNYWTLNTLTAIAKISTTAFSKQLWRRLIHRWGTIIGNTILCNNVTKQVSSSGKENHFATLVSWKKISLNLTKFTISRQHLESVDTWRITVETVWHHWSFKKSRLTITSCCQFEYLLFGVRRMPWLFYFPHDQHIKRYNYMNDDIMLKRRGRVINWRGVVIKGEQ